MIRTYLLAFAVTTCFNAHGMHHLVRGKIKHLQTEQQKRQAILDNHRYSQVICHAFAQGMWEAASIGRKIVALAEPIPELKGIAWPLHLGIHNTEIVSHVCIRKAQQKQYQINRAKLAVFILKERKNKLDKELKRITKVQKKLFSIAEGEEPTDS